MKVKLIPPFVTLSAGVIICLISIVNSFDILYSLKLLLGGLIVFYIIGLIASKVITYTINHHGEKEVIEEISEEVEDGDE